MKFSLLVGEGPHKGKQIQVAKSPFLIGRDPGCHLRPASMTISKRHCELLTKDERAFLHDLDSTNGCFVNDEPVKGEREIKDGDCLKIGPLLFTVKIVTTAAEVETPTPADNPTKAAKPAKPASAEPSPMEKTIPTKASSKPPSAHSLDEDAIGQMLLQLQEAGTEEAGDSSTSVLDGGVQPANLEDLTMTQRFGKTLPYKPPPPQQASTGNTSNAAKDILEKYRRKPKT